MKTTRRNLALFAFALGAAIVVPALVIAPRAIAEGPPPAESPPVTSASSPEASASTSTSASAGPVKPKLKHLAARLTESPLPEKPSAPPASWKGVELLAVEPGTTSCDVQLVREWLHVRCDRGDVIDVSLLSGDAAGVGLSMPGEEFNVSGDIVLPLRKGKSYVVSVTAASFGRYSTGLPESVALLWVLWSDDAPLPTVRLE